ncbi:type II toxin-antitoxin system VapC family toxin [Bifidobacterium sp. ESL0690]|uniref:type II toxin-antitoxin system VapC family toxin n=1 Tax=Bifidobacterium sp. ESL0690 TaxID=2983214 RepID=UPI0023F7A6CB|nr:type II toxin-antitoxin system VapC family toxin [Bifidobacterium sp. ESL0690]WEV46478.1 type II toxin-antitoxin system VapC family toxin [Bifidobacterium sp. ESL0690]
MILLDTNVISEISSKKRPDTHVLSWFFKTSLTDMYISTITLAELLYGIALLPEGHRKDELKSALSPLFTQFQQRTLPFATSATGYYAAMAARRYHASRKVSTPDLMIAAIAKSNRMQVATRNVKDFEDTGVEIINPWEYEN